LDLQVIQEIGNQHYIMEINTYQRATVNGVVFNSRGMDSTEPDDLHLTQTRYGSNDFSYTPTKELNNLQKT
jgi:hypothetical protein